MRVTTESTSYHNELDSMGALRKAWVWYIGFLFLPMILLVLQSWGHLVDAGSSISAPHARFAFIGTLIWIGIMGVAGFWGQEYYFSKYFAGKTVSPKDYLRGKLVVWTGLMSGAVLACFSIYLSQSYFPHMFAITIVYVFMITQYPHGRAMVSHDGNKERPELYAEPK